jgi:hypothetical protein
VKGMMQPTLSNFDSAGACGAGVQAKSINRQINIVGNDIAAESFFIVICNLVYG